MFYQLKNPDGIVKTAIIRCTDNLFGLTLTVQRGNISTSHEINEGYFKSLTSAKRFYKRAWQFDKTVRLSWEKFT